MSAGTQNKIRIWHPARDVYHGAFRMLRLLLAFPRPIEFERARLLDMFVLQPALLHRMKMTRGMREKFSALGIPDPDDLFERVPSNAAIFQDIKMYQRVAASYLVAHDILDKAEFSRGQMVLKKKSVPPEMLFDAEMRNAEQAALVSFLVDEVGAIPLIGSDSIYKRAALPGGHLLT